MMQKLTSTDPDFLSLLDNEGEKDIVKTLAERLGSTKKDITGPSRRAEIVRVRDVIAYLLREYGEMSSPAVGRLLGDRDHTTVLHAHGKVQRRIDKEPQLGEQIASLADSVKAIRDRKLRIEQDIIPQILSAEVDKSGMIKPSRTQTYREIPDRSKKILELYREGLTLQNISNHFGVTRERVRQIVVSTIRQTAVNEALSKGITMDASVLFEEESRKRKLAQDAKKEPPRPKPVAKEKRWSRYYMSCQSCGTTAIPHVRKGLCEQCVGQFRAERREDIINQHGSKCDTCARPRHEAISAFSRDFYITKDKKVLCRECFLKNSAKKMGGYKKYEWSRHYPQCKNCGTTTIKHMKKGLCENCSDTLTVVKREQIIEEHSQKCDRCNRGREAVQVKFKRDLYVTRNQGVVCMGCFKSNSLKRNKKAA